MGFTMTYDKRNRTNLDKLAPNTKVAAYKWYQWCIDHEIDLLIVQTTRTLEEQKANVAKGVSQTMKSYHLVGQALDFVPIVDGKDIWDNAIYKKEPYISAIRYAQSIGFESGLFWSGFVDSPHLQYNYKGYGTDKVLDGGSANTSSPASVKSYLEKGDSGDSVKELQTLLNKLGYDVGEIDGDFGDKTDAQVRKFQSDCGLDVDGCAGQKTMNALKCAVEDSTSYKTIIPNLQFWQAKALVSEYEKRGFKCEGVALKVYENGAQPEENDPYMFVIYCTLKDAKLLVIELKRDYPLTYGEEIK